MCYMYINYSQKRDEGHLHFTQYKMRVILRIQKLVRELNTELILVYRIV